MAKENMDQNGKNAQGLQSEALYPALFDNSKDAFLIMDGPVFIDCNLAAVKMLKAKSKDTVLSLQPFEISPEYQPNGALSSKQQEINLQKVFEEGHLQFEWLYLDVEGGEFLVEVTLTGFRGAERQLLSVSWRDITERKRLEAQVQEAFQRRGEQVQISTEISWEISQATELGELIASVVTLTKERLGYYHSQLLRYDPAQNAVVLIDGYGEPGRQMAVEGHRMPLGVGLIGTAAATGETVMRPDLAEDLDWQPNPILPQTRGEIAVPIKLGVQVLGVLDIQSDQAGALTDDDRLLLEGICGQVAIAMDQTRLRQEMEDSLQEISALYRSMSREGWQRYEETGDLPDGFVFDQTTLRPVSADDLSEEFVAQIPLTLPGGEIIGSIGVDDYPENPLSADDREFLEQVSDQIALALENARLAGQTQEALSETEVLLTTSRVINEATSIEGLLNGVAEMAPLMGIDSVSLFRVVSWDDNNQPRTADFYTSRLEDESNIFSTIYSDGPVTNPEFISAVINAPNQAMIFEDAADENRPMPPTIRENLVRQGFRGSVTTGLLSGGRVLGFLTLNSRETMELFPEHNIRILRDVLSEQVSSYLENMRLMDQSQRKADSEALVNIIGQRIQSTTSVEDALQVAIKELGQALGGKKTSVKIGLPRNDDGKKAKQSAAKLGSGP
jgi:PAS domain S-box-containing protein